jgi:hypothetical protein
MSELAFKPSEKAVYSPIPEDKSLQKDLNTYLLTYGTPIYKLGTKINGSTSFYTIPAGNYFFLTAYSLTYTDTGAAEGFVNLKINSDTLAAQYSTAHETGPAILSVSPSIPLRLNEQDVFSVGSDTLLLRGTATINGYLIEISQFNLLFK